jgi:hypothetical protein
VACVPLSSPEERIQELTERLKRFTEFAIAHMEWDAMVLSEDGPWIDLVPGYFWRKFEEVQRLRNLAMPL